MHVCIMGPARMLLDYAWHTMISGSAYKCSLVGTRGVKFLPSCGWLLNFQNIAE